MNLNEYNLLMIQIIAKCWNLVQVTSGEEAVMPEQKNGGADLVLVSLKVNLIGITR